MSPPSTRERLIQAAFTVVARVGLEAASVKAIAVEAGLTPGLLHYHFPTKDALLEAALRDGLAAYLSRVRDRRLSTPADRQISAYFEDARNCLSAEADFFRVRLSFAARALAQPELAAIMRDLNAQAITETALTFAAAAKRDKATARDLALASTLKAAFDGLVLAWLTDPEFPIQEAGSVLEAAIRSSIKAA